MGMPAVARERQPEGGLRARTRYEGVRSLIRARRRHGKENRRGRGRDAMSGRMNAPAPLSYSRAAAGVSAAATLWAFCASRDVRAAESGSGASSPGLSRADAVAPALCDNRRSIDARLNRVANRFSLRAAGNRFRLRISVDPRVERPGSVPGSTGEPGSAGGAPVPAGPGRNREGGSGTFVRHDGARGRAARADNRSRELVRA